MKPIPLDQIEFPSVLLPNNIASGSIVDITVARNHAAEATSASDFQALQKRILNTYGIKTPSPPVLRLRNATQTSLVLEWDPIDLATASLKSLSLYRNGSKAGSIPRPFEMRSTKISGLAIHTEYTFHLVLRTSAGTYQSEKLTCRTHKMTDLSGITVTAGILPPQQKEALATALDRIGGKLIDTVRIDTTHFVCTEGRGPLWEKAVEMNIPVVVPEWVNACEAEGTIVSVRGYYLNADPKARQLGPIHGSAQHRQNASTASIATTAQAPAQSQSQTNLQAQPTRERGQSTTSTNGQSPSAETQEDPEEDETPPSPPPKDDAPQESSESTSPEDAQPKQNGESEPAPETSETTSPDEKEEQPEKSGGLKEPEHTPNETSDAEAEAGAETQAQADDQPSSNGEKKSKGKESEGDFNEVPL